MAQEIRHIFIVTDLVAQITKELGVIPRMYREANSGDKRMQFALIIQFYGGKKNLPKDRSWLDWNDFLFQDTGEIANPVPVKSSSSSSQQQQTSGSDYERPYCCCDATPLDSGCTMCDIGYHERCSRV